MIFVRNFTKFWECFVWKRINNTSVCTFNKKFPWLLSSQIGNDHWLPCKNLWNCQVSRQISMAVFTLYGYDNSVKHQKSRSAIAIRLKAVPNHNFQNPKVSCQRNLTTSDAITFVNFSKWHLANSSLDEKIFWISQRHNKAWHEGLL